MRAPPRPPRGVAIVALGAFVLAFAARLAWLLHVQSPLDAVYSDMGGYVDRAEWLLAGKTPAEPRILVMFPPGTHWLMALEFLVLGRHAQLGIAIAHALVGAVPAACAAALTARLVPSLAAATIAGALVAFWYPQVAFAGFFSSELWFSAAIAVQAWLAGRRSRHPAALLVVGAASAAAMVVRSQFMLTWGIEMAVVAASLVRWRGARAAARDVALLALPVALTLAFTAARFHRVTGRWALINDSGANRLWADTDVCEIKSSWRTPNGEEWSYWFNPPSKPGCKPSGTAQFQGYIVDPVILDRIRRERLRGVTFGALLRRRLHNVELLVVDNLPWPESNYHDTVWFEGFGALVSRVTLQRAFRDLLLFAVLPLCAAGLALGRRGRTMLVLVANLVTIVIAAAFFFGEARYHVPYDPLAIVLAVAGAYELGRRGARLVRRRARAQA